jgi:DNA-binding beta-propeller fold protein YncE
MGERMGTEESLVVVLGDRRYRVEHNWGKLPAGMRLGQVSQLAVDSKGRVYVFQRAEPPVLVFEPTGAFRGSLAEGRIADAHGIAVAPDDRILLVDRDAHEVLIFSPGGELLGTLGERHRPRDHAPLNHPADVAVAPDGEIYVADGYGNSMVHRFTSTGEHRQSWGRPGKEPGQFTTPHAVWVDRQDRVLVADRENDRVQVFNRGGRYLAEWRDFYHPMDIYEDAEGGIYVTDQIPRLSQLAPDGTLVGRCRPSFNTPHGVWGAPDGAIFIAEMNPSQVVKLTPER